MPTQPTPTNSTPATGTGQGGGLRGAAAAIGNMLSDDFTITDTGHDAGGNQSAQHHESPRREPRAQQQQTEHDDNEPLVREDVEEIDDEGNVRFRDVEDPDAPVLEEIDDPNDDPDAQQQEAKTGELKDDVKVTISVGDGKTEDVTLGELKKGYLRTADYTRKTQALAAERDTIAKDRTDVSAERASLTTSIELVDRFVKEILPPEPSAAEWEALRQRDPAGFAAAREEWRSFKERMQGVAAAFRQSQEGQQAELQRQIRDTATREKEKLQEAIPEWKDARVKKRDIADMFDTARKLGFTEDDVKNTVDSRLMLLLRKATQYDRMIAAKAKLNTQRGRSDADPSPKVKNMAPGARGQVPTRKTAVVNARDQHHKQQNVRSGAALIERLLD